MPRREKGKVCITISFTYVNTRWDSVITRLSCVSLPADILDDIYEQIFIELFEKGEHDMCKYLLLNCGPLIDMKSRSPMSGIRFKRLENLHPNAEVDLYRGSSRNERRSMITEKLRGFLHDSHPGRLLSLLRDAFAHERSLGNLPLSACSVDLLTGTVAEIKPAAEKISSVIHHIEFPKGSIPNCCIFTSGYLITGSSDGLVEMWDIGTGELDLSLEFQAQGNFIVHASPISCIDIDVLEKLIVCGDVAGDIRVWDITTGDCVKEFVYAHSDACTAVRFLGQTSSQIVAASVGGSMKVFGINSGRALREYSVDSTGYAVELSFLPNWDIVAGFSDGSVRLLSGHSASQLAEFQSGLTDEGPSQPSAVAGVKVVKVNSEELLLVCTRSDTIYLTSLTGAVYKKFSVSGDQLTGCTVSNAKDVFYCSSASGKVYTFAFDQEDPIHIMAVTDGELSSLCRKHNSSEVAICSSKSGAYILGTK